MWNQATILHALLLATGLLGVMGAGEETCQVCMAENEAYCHNATSYQFCMGGKPIGDVMNCATEKICTTAAAVCEPESSGTPACKNSCGKCPEDTETYKTYTCVGKNQFARCTDSVAGNAIACADGELCSAEVYAATGKICVTQCVMDFFEYSPTCSGSASDGAGIPKPEDMKQVCEAKKPDPMEGNYYLTANPDEKAGCQSYIYCEQYNNGWVALFYTCSGYFDEDKMECVDTKPEACG